jgi:uncharacterized protein YigE (DUF2233 family)
VKSVSLRTVARGKRILISVVVTSGLWLVWQRWNRPEHRANSVQSACSQVQFEGEYFTVCRFDPAHHIIALALNDGRGKPLRGFAKLAQDRGKEARQIVFAMNAGMYDLSGNPIGLYVEGGQTRQALNRNDGPGNFHLKPNGVFWRDPAGLHVASSDVFDARNPSAEFATQSGPMLVIDGKLHPQFSSDGTSRNVRNGVGVTATGKAIFAISTSEVSFGKFARLFRDHLQCPNALYFDGLVSSLWDAASGRIDQKFPLGPMVVVSELRTP